MQRLKNTTVLNINTPQSLNKKDNKVSFQVWTVEGMQTRLGYVKGNYAIHDVGRDEIAITHLPSGQQLYKFLAFVCESKIERRKKAYDLMDRLSEVPDQVFPDSTNMPPEFKKSTIRVLKKVCL